MRAVYFVAVLCLCLQEHHGADWDVNPPDGTLKYACAGDNVTLAWKLVVSPTEEIEDILWFFSGHSQELIASSVNGTFNPLATFSGRVKFEDNAGITLSNVVVLDSGDYSVRAVILDNGGTYSTRQRHVKLDVKDHLLTNDSTLHVQETPDAVLNKTTGQWSIELQCGFFSYTGLPPFTVEWLDPTGNVLQGSDYDTDHFSLQLSDPIQGGTYTCQIPPQDYASACLHGNGAAAAAQAAISVDAAQTQIKLLKAENAALKEEVKNLTSQVGPASTERIMFFADMIPIISSDNGQRLMFDGQAFIFNEVELNLGHAYNNVTGVFTVPRDGEYFFTAMISVWRAPGSTTTTSTASTVTVYFCLHVDGYPNGRFKCVSSPKDVYVLTAKVRLTTGTRVWVEARTTDQNVHFYDARLSQFEGYLIGP